MGHEGIAPARRPQHLEALERANRVRLARANLKRAIASGQTAPAEIVLRCPEEAERMALSDLLMSQQRWGRTRTRRFLAEIGLRENKQLVSLTERQRTLLAQRLEDRGTGRTAVGAMAPATIGHDTRIAAAV